MINNGVTMDLQKEIEEFKTKAQRITEAMPSLKVGSFQFACYQQGFCDGEKITATKALSIINQLQEEIKQPKEKQNDK